MMFESGFPSVIIQNRLYYIEAVDTPNSGYSLPPVRCAFCLGSPLDVAYIVRRYQRNREGAAFYACVDCIEEKQLMLFG